MTLLAQERHAHFQQIGGHCAVGIVAIGAVFRHRLMVPKEGPALFRVTLETGVIDRVADKITGPRRAMGVVTIGAYDLALQDRVPGRPVGLYPLFLVALEADSGLCPFVTYLVVPVVVNFMAGIA